MKRILLITLAIVSVGLAVGSVQAQSGVYTPAVGSPQRKTILDGVRKFRNAPNEVYTPRVFRVAGGWAYVAAPDPSDPGVDTLAFDLVLRKSGGTWKVVDQISHVEGTDYASEVQRIRRKFRSLPRSLLRS
jgi:hypothetical protein